LIGQVVSKTPNHSGLRLSEAGSLFVDHAKSSDAGRYRCRAISGGSAAADDDVTVRNDVTVTRLVVFNASAKLLLQTVGSDFVGVTWQGLGSTVASTRYAILYRLRQEYQLTLPSASTSG